MKPAILMAIAGSMIIHGVNVCKNSNDVFSKADKNYHQKKCNPSAKNTKAKNWRTCRAV
ncbi:hypothetical protein HQ865_03835 [Mucilaginibacter mali]|uniref:Uncharacterized protein n=1 Tax=Mucilaginibacter mali TaxID=2740462 RepID=A0A7D4UKU8_9SPHI|nr:hypothetical protein [Mucilaginibacter mali]QKJ28921.1 hypothetical protein HQ865_03835 [Mucilaginibacter mali]